MRAKMFRRLAGAALLALILAVSVPALAQGAGASITTDNALLVGLAAETGFDDVLWALAVSSDGLVAAGGGDDAPGAHAIYLWDAATAAALPPLAGHDGQVRALAFNDDGSHLLSGGFDGAAIIWDVETGAELLRLDGAPVWSAAFSAGGDLIALGRGTTEAGSAVIEVVDTASGGVAAELPLPDSLWPPFTVAFAPDSAVVMTGDFDGSLLLWEWETNIVNIVPVMPDANYPIGTAVYSPDGALAAAAIGFVAPIGNIINLVDMEALALDNPPLTGHERLVLGVSFHPDGGLLASGSEDGTVRLWDVAQRRELAALDHGSAVLGVGFALDGSLLVSASRDGLVRAWAAPG